MTRVYVNRPKTMDPDMTSGSVSLPAIITTADHPLLSADMLRVFIKEAQDTGADFCVGLASKEIIHPTYPHVKRTYLKFSDISVSGCNLFYVATKDGIEAIRFWLQAQHYRKRPDGRYYVIIFWGA